jgi:dipeptidyl aminopeptidase/acylaminoacyl peptidase
VIGFDQSVGEVGEVGAMTVDGIPEWRQRFRAPHLYSAVRAGRRPDRGLVIGSPNGRTIQLLAWDVPSGRLEPVTDAVHDVFEAWLDPTGSHVYYLRDEDGNEHGHLMRVPYEGGPPVDVTPGLPPYTLRGVGFDAAGTRLAINPVNADGFALYAIDLGEGVGEPRLLHRDSWEFWGALLSARGDLAACWSTARARGVRRHTLLVFDAVTGELIGELDDGREAKVVGTVFAPTGGDDRILASTTRSGFTRPVIWNPRTGERHDALLPELDGDVAPLDWSADTGEVLVCQFGGPQRLHVYDPATRGVRALSHPPGSYLDPIAGGVGFGPDGTIVGLRHTATAPPEVVELDAATGRRLRALVPSGVAPAGRPWRSVTIPSVDKTPVQVWVATPDGDGPFPTILETHGGPHYTESEYYSAGVQCWLDHGFAWISVNYRGSLGFGGRFAEQIWGDLGRWELEDMTAARAWAVDQGIARPDQVIAYGASYGGYLTLFALGRRPDLWAGGIAVAADADLAACYEDSSDALRAAVAGWMKGTPSERPEAYARSSPITYAADFTAPVLVINARNDTRVPARQMQRFEQRMRELGKDIELDWLAGGHQSVGPEVWLRCHERMLTFTDRVLGKPVSD